MKGDLVRCKHILQSIEVIGEFVSDMSFEDFRSDLRTQSAVILHLAIIGEAVNNLSATLREKTPEVPWREIVASRNILIHEYFRVDIDNVWDTCQNDLAVLESQIKQILSEIV